MQKDPLNAQEFEIRKRMFYRLKMTKNLLFCIGEVVTVIEIVTKRSFWIFELKTLNEEIDLACFW